MQSTAENADYCGKCESALMWVEGAYKEFLKMDIL